MIADGTPVGDYHSWVRPVGPDCPRCSCCTVALCEMGAQSLEGCEGHTSHSARSVVQGCPCSSATTSGTVRHTLAVWHEHLTREEKAAPGAADRLHEVFKRRVLGPQTAKDPTLVGPRLRELIEELWPSAAGSGG